MCTGCAVPRRPKRSVSPGCTLTYCTRCRLLKKLLLAVMRQTRSLPCMIIWSGAARFLMKRTAALRHSLQGYSLDCWQGIPLCVGPLRLMRSSCLATYIVPIRGTQSWADGKSTPQDTQGAVVRVDRPTRSCQAPRVRCRLCGARPLVLQHMQHCGV
jgi:hypothetical protein